MFAGSSVRLLKERDGIPTDSLGVIRGAILACREKEQELIVWFDRRGCLAVPSNEIELVQTD